MRSATPSPWKRSLSPSCHIRLIMVWIIHASHSVLSLMSPQTQNREPPSLVFVRGYEMLSRPKRLPALLALCWALILAQLPPAHAQGSYLAVINYPEISEGPNALSLGLYYTMIDGSGQVVSDAEIQSVAIGLGDGSSYEASFGKPSSKTYIVLVLDASGSMIQMMGAMRQAAAQAVETAPEDATFAIISFNNVIKVVQDFTADRDDVVAALSRVYSVPNAGTCLYDAAYRALEHLQNAPRGRRAIVLFTDGKDEKAGGAPCSQHTYEDVINFATRQDARVPIHTIGLTTRTSSALNEDQLRELASLTGGFSEAGGKSSLSLLFIKIIESMGSQWIALA